MRPILEFLLAQGNRPAKWWYADGWRSDPGGELHNAFTDPIDAAELRQHFTFPLSIKIDDAGTIRNGVNQIDIYYDRPAKPMSFEGLAAITIA